MIHWTIASSSCDLRVMYVRGWLDLHRPLCMEREREREREREGKREREKRGIYKTLQMSSLTFFA